MKHQQPTLRFLGATDTVAGSRYLVEAGGKRVLVATEGTMDLCKLLLADSGHLQEEEARYATQRGFSGSKMASISARGMLTGGRILQHVAAPGPDPKRAIILSGYQAAGTRGAAFAAGARELHSYGEDVPIRAQVIQMENLSAHADAAGRIAWLNAAEKEPRMTYITHGEPDAPEALRVRIKRQLGRRARAPEHLDKISLEEPR
jgi:Cft2 family RNA processing exonuclease